MSRPFHRKRTFLETALNRTPEQLVGIMRRKLENTVLPRLPVDVDRYYERRVPSTVGCVRAPFDANTARLRGALSTATTDRYREKAHAAANGEVTLLNATHRFGSGDRIDWTTDRLGDEPLLWRLKLEGFVHFAWPVFGYADPSEAPATLLDGYEQWFRTWDASRRIGDEPGFLRRAWIPHSVSLRILNWCRYLGWAGDRIDSSLRDAIVRAVAKNAAFLADHVEYDLDGNHLVENAVALVAAGILTDTDRWCQAGIDVFERTARTQFLADGGHFERSPMYHTIVTTRFLTAIDLLSATDRSVPASLRTTAADAVTFLLRLRPPDDRIPLLHDSVYGEALALSACLSYARAVGVQGTDEGRAQSLRASGYYWLGDSDDALLCAGGPIATQSVPGHAHVHPGHVSLYVGERPVLTDSGTYTYASGERRTSARSIAGHNTVQVDGSEPVAIADSFLMGEPIRPTATFTTGDVTELTVDYEAAFGPPYRHQRTAHHADDWWLIWDTIEADKMVSAVARYHCHPSVDITTSRSHSTYRLRRTSDIDCFVRPLRGGDTSIRTSEYYPEFGIAQDRPVVNIESTRDRTHTIGCLFQISDREVTVAGERRPERLTVGNETYDLSAPSNSA